MKCIALTVVVLLSPWMALAQTTQPALTLPVITLSTGVEDGKNMIHALVALKGKPVENVVLQYFVQRTFGNLQLGEDTTLDDGTSAIAFPSDLVGGADGKLHVMVRVKAPSQFASASASTEFVAGKQPAATAEAFPRALWAPNAPLALMLSIFVLLAAVWLSYAFVVSRIVAIRVGGKQ